MSSNCYVLIGFINIPSIQILIKLLSNQSGLDTTVKLLLKKIKTFSVALFEAVEMCV